jgi:hypothetical protein
VKKPFNNQFATQKLRQETSMTNSGGATFTPGTGEQMATNKAFKKKPKKEVKDVEPKLAAGKAKIYMKDKWGWKEAPSIPNRPSKGGFIYKQLFEALNDAVKEYRDTDENINPFEPGDRIKVTYGNKFYGMNGTVEDVTKTHVIVSIDGISREFSMHYTDVDYVGDDEGPVSDYSKYRKDPSYFEKDYQEKGTSDYFQRRGLDEGHSQYLKPSEETDIEQAVNKVKTFINPNSRFSHFKGVKSLGDTTKNDLENASWDNEDQYIVVGRIDGKIYYSWSEWDQGYGRGENYENEIKDIDEVFSQKDYDRVKVVLSKIRDKNSKLYNAIIDALSDVYPHDLDKEFGSDIQAAGLNENYSRFKNETKTRSKSDQFHQAVRAVRQKVQEINRLFEYVSRLKQELSEGEGGLKYRMHTEKALAKIKDMVNELNKNVKKFK